MEVRNVASLNERGIFNDKNDKKAADAHTVSGMHFESMQAAHAAPHHHHVAAGVFIHPLNDLVVQVGVVEVVLVDCETPRIGQATDHRHSRHPIHGAALNLGRQRTDSKKRGSVTEPNQDNTKLHLSDLMF